jgi:hypothetical protein
MRKVPAWMVAYAQVCREALGLADWPVAIVPVKRVDDSLSNGHGTTRALTTSSWRTLDAKLEIQRDLPADADGYVTLTHEFLHMALVHQDQAVYRILDLLPRKRRTFAEQLWRDGLEQTVERLARALTPVLRAQLPPPATKEPADGQ